MIATLLVTLLATPPAAAGPTPALVPPAAVGAPATTPSYLGLAERLRQDGQFEGCAVEALRHGYAHPEDAPRADERAALCLDLAGRFRDARVLLTRLDGEAGLDAHARYRLCYTEVFLSDVPMSETCRPKGAAASREAARYLVLASYTQVMRPLLQRHYEAAAAELDAWPTVPEGTLADWQAQDRTFLQRSRTLEHRSPLLAGLLSAILPGLGRAYIGRWGDAAFSLVLTGAPAGFGAYEFTRYGVSSVGGWVLASFAGLFYLGDIYGSAIGAVLFNRAQADALAGQVKESYLGRADP